MALSGSVARVALLVSSLLTLGVWGCGKQDSQVVRLERREVLQSGPSIPRQKPLRIGMGAMISPKEGYLYYHQLKQYLEEKLGRPVQLVDRDTYGQVIKLMSKGDLDASFLCAGPYVEVHDRFGLEALAMPQVNGSTRYEGYIIVPEDSPVRVFTDLRGKTFAFIDPKSNTGRLVPTYMLARVGETPERFFRKVIYTYGHDRSIRAVAEKMVDGAAVSSHVWNLAAKRTPELIAKTRIIARSGSCSAPPFVAGRALDASTRRRLRATLLAMNEDPRGREVLAAMMIERFVPGDDRNYDDIRQMAAYVAHRQGRHPR
jgi:phosphonate transport system substrate-binding protein